MVGDPLGTLLFLFGVGFLAASLALVNDYLAWMRRRPHALLTWAVARPRTFVLSRAIAVGLIVVILYKLLVLHWPAGRMFGEAMMLAYYAVFYPASFRVQRGFYQGGVWLDRAFVPYSEITGLTWREDPGPSLIVVAGHRQRAGRLRVPAAHLGEARRLLRDRIKAQELQFEKPPLDLGGHDQRDDV